jgi:copper transport protein
VIDRATHATAPFAALALALVALTLAPASASAHAVLKGTEPASGGVLKREPDQIGFKFSEPVEGKFGAIRIYDRNAKRVESGDAFHPGGEGSSLAAHLKPGLGKGTYTATYRVISADGHPVSGGLVFSIGKPGATGATVSQLLAERQSAGHVTQVAFGVARGFQYASIALAIGSLFFLLAIWMPGLASVAGSGREWQLASERFAARLRGLLIFSFVAGIASGALGIVFQGATAAGVSFWSALDSAIVRDVLATRFGTVWAIRLLVWVVLSAAAVTLLSSRRMPVLRPASVGATGLALSRGLAPLGLALIAMPLAFLAISPALAGHASLQSPSAVLFPANVLHVLAISIWSAGLVMLVVVLPAATRRLERPDRTRLLAAVLARFSTVALVAVTVILLTGLVQSWFEIRHLDNLLHTAFGRAALIKFGILVGPLAGLGTYNRQRMLPRLKRIAASGEPPGEAGFAVRRALRLEVALIAVVLGVTAALVSYAPSTALSGGIFSTTKSLGPADLQMTVDPARVGQNVVHVFLIDKKTGTQFTKVKEFRLTLSEPDKQVGPIDARPRKAGPGHWVVNAALFGVAGDWQAQISARVSDFDAYYATVKVPIH